MDYTHLASPDIVKDTIAALKERNIQAVAVENASDALSTIIGMIPSGASIMNGASQTLEQIGFVEYLKSREHGWNNLHEAIVHEQDSEKQSALRKQALMSDYYLGSVHALAQTGEFIIASNTGSQLPHVVFTSPNLIFVVSTKKIVPTLTDAFDRLEKHVIPLEDERAQKAYGSHTAPNKIIVFNGENPMMGRTVHIIFVNERLGF